MHTAVVVSVTACPASGSIVAMVVETNVCIRQQWYTIYKHSLVKIKIAACCARIVGIVHCRRGSR